LRIPLLVVTAIISLSATAADGAQRQRPADVPLEQRQADAKRQRAADPDLAPARILNMLDAWAIVQAQDTLQLGDDQYGPFVTRLKNLQQTRRRNLQGRVAILQELRRLTAGPAGEADDNTLRDKLKALADHDDAAAAEMRKAYEQLDQVLTPRQQARFRLFEEVLERRKIDLLKRAQQGAAARERRQ
jgi:Spy/CpxP family protein refolding chaperone